MLINGSDLSRNATYKAEEKGLILASNLPVYIKGNFNVHTQEEFKDRGLKNVTDWSGTFYGRSLLNANFACRKGQPSCGLTGETWRPTTVLGDAITVLSNDFRLGFRNEGDYDLNNNYDTIDKDGNPVFLAFDADGSGSLGTVNESDFGFDLNGDGDATDNNVSERNKITTSAAAKIKGFWDNNFVTSRNFRDGDYSGGSSGTGSSYFNNFVTPIQRRVQFTEYLMETCPKKIVTTCTANDWVVGYDLDDDGNFSNTEKNIKANELAQAVTSTGANLETSRIWAGTTVQPGQDQSLPRRVAFLRYSAGLTVEKSGTSIIPGSKKPYTLVLDPVDKTPIPIGIKTGGKEITYYPYSNELSINSKPYKKYSSNSDRRYNNNALWFLTNKSNAKDYSYENPLWIHNKGSLTGDRPTEQPLLIPVLQIQIPFQKSGKDFNNRALDKDTYNKKENDLLRKNDSWQQKAIDTETNLVFAQGNTPGRPTESNGGLENFIRYLENWEDKKHNALGAFIQYKRSSYATAPWQVFTAPFKGLTSGHYLGYTTGSGTNFGYAQGYRIAQNKEDGAENFGRTPFYTPPQRFWGYDVALLTQLPDLFSQRFTTPATNDPNEFYREVGRDDNWVETLLCAAQNNTQGYENSSKHGTGYKYAVPSNQRPNCP